MNLRSFLASLAVFLLSGAARCLRAQPNSADVLSYKTGYSAMMKLGRALYDQLDAKQKEMISSQPISMDVDMTPFVRMMYYPEGDAGGKPLRGVWISAGFIDLCNHVAHAKAIDRVQKGYFQKYITLLMNESGDKEMKQLPDD